LGEVSDAVEKLKKQPGVWATIAASGTPILSMLAAQVHNKLIEGTPAGAALAELNTAVHRFSEEVSKFYGGSQAAEGQRLRAIANLNAARSLEELRAAVAYEAKLMKDQVDTYEGRGITVLGEKRYRRVLSDAPVAEGYKKGDIVQREAAEALLRIEARRLGKDVPGGDKTLVPGGARKGAVMDGKLPYEILD
jgi:hypothetical protein